MSNTDAAMLLVLVAVAVMFTVTVIRTWQERADARRREAERRLYQERKEQTEIRRSALQAALEEVPGVRLGEMSVVVGNRELRVPAIWPSAERRKHAYVGGRTGAGKSTALCHAMKADIDAGHGVGVLAPDSELFSETLLPMCARRAGEVLYWAPGNPGCTITLGLLAIEPGDDRARAVGDLFEILRRAIGKDGFGTRMAPLLGNSLALITGRPGATLLDIPRLFEDVGFRAGLVSALPAGHLNDYWTRVYPAYPAGAHVPLVGRLDELLRGHVGRALCAPTGFSMREVFECGRILLVDLGRLDPPARAIIGQVVLAKLQLELLRRESQPSAERRTFHLYADEFQTFAAMAPETWSELLSRGRQYGLAIALANQFPSQLPVDVRDEVLSNVASVIAFSLGSKDSEAIRKELLYHPVEGEPIRPVPIEALVNQRVGRAVAKLGTGGLAFQLDVDPPVKVPPIEVGRRVQQGSWKRFGTPHPQSPIALARPDQVSTLAAVTQSPAIQLDLSDVELRYLKAVVQNPGQASAEYAKLVGLNGTRGAAVRKKLIEKGLVREHRLARKAAGKPALILEPLEPARQAVTAAAKEPGP